MSVTHQMILSLVPRQGHARRAAVVKTGIVGSALTTAHPATVWAIAMQSPNAMLVGAHSGRHQKDVP